MYGWKHTHTHTHTLSHTHTHTHTHTPVQSFRVSCSDLEHEDLSAAALAAVEGDVLVACVRMEAADALVTGQERGVKRTGRGRIRCLLRAGDGIQTPQHLHKHISNAMSSDAFSTHNYYSTFINIISRYLFILLIEIYLYLCILPIDVHI